MQCERCGEREAVIQFTKVEKDDVRVLQLCEPCAADQGVDTTPAAPAPLVDFLAQIGRGVADDAAPGGCPSCGLKAAPHQPIGRLGCATSYTHFEQHLRSLLRRLHGGTQHAGKVAVSAGGAEPDHKARARSLRRSLQRAVDSEDFEHAAVLRDQIRRLEADEEGES